MLDMNWVEKLIEMYDACPKAAGWLRAGEFASPQEAWDDCGRGDWMLCLLGQTGTLNNNTAVEISCRIVRQVSGGNAVWGLLSNPILREAVNTAGAWLAGKASLEAVQAAAAAAAAVAAALEEEAAEAEEASELAAADLAMLVEKAWTTDKPASPSEEQSRAEAWKTADSAETAASANAITLRAAAWAAGCAARTAESATHVASVIWVAGSAAEVGAAGAAARQEIADIVRQEFSVCPFSTGEEIIHFAELDAARLRGKELDARAGVIAGLLDKSNLAQVMKMWKPAHGKTIPELAGDVTVRNEWEMQAHWERVYWAFVDSIESSEYILLSVENALYAVREYGSPDEYSAVLDELEKLAQVAESARE